MNEIKDLATQAGIAVGSSLAIGTALGISPLESLVIGTAGAALIKAQEYFATDVLSSETDNDKFLKHVRYGAIGTTALLLGGLDAFILSKTSPSLSKELLLQGGAYSAVNLFSLITAEETPEPLHKTVLKKGRNGLIALGIVLAGYFAPEMHCSHVASIPTQPETSSQEDKIETAAQRDTGDALTPYTQLLGQAELFTVKAYSRGFRQGDIVVVEFDPAEHHLDSLNLSYSYKQTEKGKHVSQKVQTTTIDGETYGFVAIDFEHPAQTVEVTVSASVDNLTFTENYSLTFVAADFQKQEMGKKSAMTPAGEETFAQKRATRTFYNSWKTVTPELYAHDYSPPTTRECNVAGFGNYRYWEGQEKPGRHNGIDCSGTKDSPIQAGEPIYAIFDGVVTYTSPEQLQLTGITTTIDHGFGLYTWYAHQSQTTVTTKQEINVGDKIGEVGSTGRSSGPHLHIGAKLYGLNVNPDSLQILSLIIDNDNR